MKNLSFLVVVLLSFSLISCNKTETLKPNSTSNQTMLGDLQKVPKASIIDHSSNCLSNLLPQNRRIVFNLTMNAAAVQNFNVSQWVFYWKEKGTTDDWKNAIPNPVPSSYPLVYNFYPNTDIYDFIVNESDSCIDVVLYYDSNNNAPTVFSYLDQYGDVRFNYPYYYETIYLNTKTDFCDVCEDGTVIDPGSGDGGPRP